MLKQFEKSEFVLWPVVESFNGLIHIQSLKNYSIILKWHCARPREFTGETSQISVMVLHTH